MATGPEPAWDSRAGKLASRRRPPRLIAGPRQPRTAPGVIRGTLQWRRPSLDRARTRRPRRLGASAIGLGVAEVADLLGLSPDAVRASIASAITKLGARSKLEAVVVALRGGLIEIPRGPS